MTNRRLAPLHLGLATVFFALTCFGCSRPEGQDTRAPHNKAATPPAESASLADQRPQPLDSQGASTASDLPPVTDFCALLSEIPKDITPDTDIGRDHLMKWFYDRFEGRKLAAPYRIILVSECGRTADGRYKLCFSFDNVRCTINGIQVLFEPEPVHYVDGDWVSLTNGLQVEYAFSPERAQQIREGAVLTVNGVIRGIGDDGLSFVIGVSSFSL